VWDAIWRERSGSDREPVESSPARGTRRVVIIEDERDIAMVLCEMLEIEGHGVEVAHDGERGIDLIRRTRPDVALVDIALPGIDGYEVARRLRASGEKLYLIALTGLGREQDRARAFEAGFDLHVLKPGDPDDIVGFVASSPRHPDETARPPDR
jgi:DNA-binding response OmpR family regulator